MKLGSDSSIINMKDLKSLVLTKTEDFFKGKDFLLNVSQQKFSKEVPTAKIDFCFKFYDYFPSYQEYSFIAYIFFKELEEIQQEFSAFSKIAYDNIWHIMIPEGEFIYELLNKELKYKKMYTNQVDTIRTAEESINQTLQILKNDALPKVYLLSSLDGFQQFFFNHPERIASRVADDWFVLTCLLAAYKAHQEVYLEMFELILKELNKWKLMGREFSSIYILLGRMSNFIKFKNYT